MKKIMKKAFVLLLALCMTLTCFVATGCNQETEKGNKTILNVANYSGGVGVQWIKEVEKRFEQACEGISYEEGKSGVDVKVWNHKSYIGTTLASTLAGDTNDVYFTQELPYSNLASLGQLLDITDLVTEKVGSDGKTIFSKFAPEHKTGLKINNKYFAIPHYEVFQGIVYDSGIFTKKNLFFANELDTDSTYPGTCRFVVDAEETKSCGPDGKFNTYDDGLPSSIAEFKKLIDEMTGTASIDPFIYAGGHDYYTNMLNASIAANINGADTMRLFLNFGDYSDLEPGATVPSTKARIVDEFDYNDYPVVNEYTITPDNGYLLKQSEGLYWGVDLATYVWGDTANWSANISSGTSQIDAQNEFMCCGIDGQTNYAGMLIEGNYWYNEANDEEVFADLKIDFPTKYKEKKPKFMPLPVQAEGTVTEGNGKAPVLLDNYSSYSFINANIDKEKIDLAKDFLSFCYTDFELEQFTINTKGVARSVEYDVEEAFSALASNEYATSLVQMRKAAADAGNIVRWCTDNSIYVNNEQTFKPTTNSFWSTRVENTSYALVLTAAQNSISAKDYFKGFALTSGQWSSMK